MALNPPILSIPTQEADRNEHIQRFLISLPRHGPGSDGDLRGTDDLMEHDQAVQDGDNDRERKEESEVALGPQAGRAEQGPDLEAERRRYEHKIRRREKAAILNPKPPVSPVQDPGGQKGEELPDEWWDDLRRRQRQRQHGRGSGDVGPRNSTNSAHARAAPASPPPRPEREREQRRIQGTGKGKGRSAPGGNGLLANYKPSAAIKTTRLTLPLRPVKRKAGIFANAKSSDPTLLQDLLGSNHGNSDQGSATVTDRPRRITLHSSSSDNGNDWRDRWRATGRPPKPDLPRPDRAISQSQHLPPPGNTQSTSWPSPLPSDPPSIAGPSSLAQRYTHRPPSSLARVPVRAASSSRGHEPTYRPQALQAVDTMSTRAPYDPYADGGRYAAGQMVDRLHAAGELQPWHDPQYVYEQLGHDPTMREFWRRGNASAEAGGPGHHDMYEYTADPHPGYGAGQLEPGWAETSWMQEPDRYQTPVPIPAQSFEHQPYDWPESANHALAAGCDYPMDSVAVPGWSHHHHHPPPLSDFHPPYIPHAPAPATPTWAHTHAYLPPAPPSLSSSYRPSLAPIDEQSQPWAEEVEQFGTSTDEWKQHWRGRRAYR